MSNDTGFEISKDYDIPPKRIGRFRKYPFDEMAPGDSFVAPLVARPSAYVFAYKHKMKFTIRRIDKDNVRIWRVS